MSSYSQKQTIEKFTVTNDTLSCLKVAYPEYGIAQVFINMYEDNNDNKTIATNAIKCLSKEENIYHTLYYFVTIPENYTLIQREEAFSALVKYIATNEVIDGRTVLYLNFDNNYSSLYNKETVRDAMLNKIQRVLVGTKPKNICARLSIDKI